MPPAINNDKLVASLRTHFVSNYSPTTAVGNVISNYLYLPQLRGFWPFSSVDENTDTYDISGQGRLMSNTGGATYGTTGLITYADFIRGNSDYMTRPTEAGLLPTGSLTLGCWVRFDAPSTGNVTGLITKYGLAGNRSYMIYKSAANALTMVVSGDGTAILQVPSTVTYAAGQWFCVIGRFIPSTSITIFVNGTFTDLAAGIPAAVFSNATAFDFGRYAASNYLDGQMTLPFLCATSLSDTAILNLWHQTRALFGG